MDKKYKFYIPGLKEGLMEFFETSTEKDLAKLFDISPQRMNHYMTGFRAIPYDLLIKIYKSTNRRGKRLNIGWLLTQDGPKTIQISSDGIGRHDLLEEANRLIDANIIDPAVILMGLVLRSVPEVDEWEIKRKIELCDTIQKKALSLGETVSIDEARLMLRTVREITNQPSLASDSFAQKKDMV